MPVELLKNVLGKDTLITTRLVELENELTHLRDKEFENAQELRSKAYTGVRLNEDIQRLKKAVKAERRAQRKLGGKRGVNDG